MGDAEGGRTSDVRPLGEIATSTGMLAVAYAHYDRRDRYRLDRLVARLGADAGVRVVAPEITADCPRRGAAALMERCDVLFPELARLFPAG